MIINVLLHWQVITAAEAGRRWRCLKPGQLPGGDGAPALAVAAGSWMPPSASPGERGTCLRAREPAEALPVAPVFEAISEKA